MRDGRHDKGRRPGRRGSGRATKRRATTPRNRRSTRGRPTRRPVEPPRPTTSAGSGELDPETERRARQIQAEIADTREELSETIDALQAKLRPSNIVSDATEKVKTATTERVGTWLKVQVERHIR